MKRHCESEQQLVVNYTLHLEYDTDRCSKMSKLFYCPNQHWMKNINAGIIQITGLDATGIQSNI